MTVQDRTMAAMGMGRDSTHQERRPTMSDRERQGYMSQRSQARMLRYRLGARARKDTAQGGKL